MRVLNEFGELEEQSTKQDIVSLAMRNCSDKNRHCMGSKHAFVVEGNNYQC